MGRKVEINYEYENQMYSLKELSAIVDISLKTMYTRISKGQDPIKGPTKLTSYEVSPTGRVCTRCKEFKEWECFYNNKAGINGKNCACIMCV
jgi:hypothetical protein